MSDEILLGTGTAFEATGSVKPSAGGDKWQLDVQFVNAALNSFLHRQNLISTLPWQVPTNLTFEVCEGYVRDYHAELLELAKALSTKPADKPIPEDQFSKTRPHKPRLPKNYTN